MNHYSIYASLDTSTIILYYLYRRLLHQNNQKNLLMRRYHFMIN